MWEHPSDEARVQGFQFDELTTRSVHSAPRWKVLLAAVPLHAGDVLVIDNRAWRRLRPLTTNIGNPVICRRNVCNRNRGLNADLSPCAEECTQGPQSAEHCSWLLSIPSGQQRIYLPVSNFPAPYCFWIFRF